MRMIDPLCYFISFLMCFLAGCKVYLPPDNPLITAMPILSMPTVHIPLLPARARFAHDPLKAGTTYPPITGSCAFRARSAKKAARARFAHDPLKAGLSPYYRLVRVSRTIRQRRE